MSTKKVLNPVETEAARAKLAEIRTVFSDWLWNDPERTGRLARTYNDSFNHLRLRQYNGEHLTLPGSSSLITLRREQKNAIWRILTSPTTLLALHPGWGKTFTMIAAFMEMRRLGLKRKGLFAVPNHLVAQFAAEYLQLYPMAKVLMADVEDFAKANRTLFTAKIATGAYDAIVIPHSAFIKLPLRPENESVFIKEQVRDLEDLLVAEGLSECDPRTVKQLESAKAKLTAKLVDLRARAYPDDTVFLEDTGIDFLAMDEVHLFKNLPIHTKMTRVAGVPTSASARALDLAVKSRWLLTKFRSGLVFSTGTPIANTLAEMYVWKLMLIPEALRKMGHHHFDGWAGTWGETVTQLELKPEGTGYRLNSRFAKFNNVPELAMLFNSFAEVRVLEDSDLPRPTLVSGKPIVVACPAPPGLKAFVRVLSERAKAIRNGAVTPAEDNMLAVTVDGRKASLDMRLVEPGRPDFLDSKVNQCARKVAELYREYDSDRGVQLIYADLATPHAAGYSVYRDLKVKLVALGIPEDQIAFIHDFETNAERFSLFRKLREGIIRILMASTEKGGTGMNIQHRLIAEHHLDVPWRPCDIEQREGRIVRYGNFFREVYIFRWVTEGSFDGYVWNLLCVKANFINSIMRARGTARSAFDVDSVILSYEECKALATGNPLIMEKAGVDAELMKLSLQEQQHLASRRTCRAEAASAEGFAQNLGEWLERARTDSAAMQPTSGDRFAMTIQDKTYAERAMAAEALVEAVKSLGPFNTMLQLGRFAGLDLLMSRQGAVVTISLAGRNSYDFGLKETSIGTLASLEHGIRHLADRIADRERDREQAIARAGQLRSESVKPFPYVARLAELTARQAELNAILQTDAEEAKVAANVECDAA